MTWKKVLALASLIVMAATPTLAGAAKVDFDPQYPGYSFERRWPVCGYIWNSLYHQYEFRCNGKSVTPYLPLRPNFEKYRYQPTVPPSTQFSFGTVIDRSNKK